MPADPNKNDQPGLVGPCEHAAAVTPNDSADLATRSRAIYVGTGGDVAVVMAGGEAVTFAGILGGSLLPVRVDRVKATGTTASNIVAVW